MAQNFAVATPKPASLSNNCETWTIDPGVQRANIKKNGVGMESGQNLRRNLLKTLGAGAFAASIGGCAPMQASSAKYPRPYSRKPWAAPRVSMDNVIRAIVGHRPYRPSGFVVKSEQFDEKTVIHNYGHGGGGISICWGSSALAVRETLAM